MSSTTSPNASESSYEPNNKDLNIGGLITSTTQDQHFMPVFSSSPSPPISMQTTVLNNTINLQPSSGGGFFNSTTGPCFLHSGFDSKGFYLENGVFGGEGEIYVPPLESVSNISDHNLKMESACNNGDKDTIITNNINSYFDDINNIVNYNCNNIKRGENRADQVENLFETVGEWDLEELMKDVSSFPFLDFSN